MSIVFISYSVTLISFRGFTQVITFFLRESRSTHTVSVHINNHLHHRLLSSVSSDKRNLVYSGIEIRSTAPQISVSQYFATSVISDSVYMIKGYIILNVHCYCQYKICRANVFLFTVLDSYHITFYSKLLLFYLYRFSRPRQLPSLHCVCVSQLGFLLTNRRRLLPKFVAITISTTIITAARFLTKLIAMCLSELDDALHWYSGKYPVLPAN